MADAKISQLTAASSTDGTEVLPIVQSTTTKKLAISKIRDYLLATANVFTKAQTFQPDSDAQAGTFRRYDASQTANVLEVQTEANAVLASIDKSGALSTPSISLSGNVSAAAWTTGGIGIKVSTRTLTDTSSSGTVSAGYTNVLGGNTIAASSATTFTDYASLHLGEPTAGTNVTLTNKWSLITAGNIRTPSVSLGVAGSTLGSLKLSGNTSGTVTVQTAAAAGTYTLTLPSTAGSTGQALTTDGSGGLSWATPSATLTVNSTATSGGGAGRVLYDDGSKLQESSSFTFNATNPALTLAGGTVTASNPLLDLSQTWNASGTTFTGIKLNVTNTASATASKLLDLQIDGTSYFQVQRNTANTKIVAYGSADIVCNASGTYQGINFYGGNAYNTGAGITVTGNSNAVPNEIAFFRNGFNQSAKIESTGALVLWGGGSLGFSSSTGNVQSLLSADVTLYRDAADTLAQRRGTNAQVQRIYDTYTSATDYHRLAIATARATLSSVTGAAVTATGLIPAGAIVVGVTTKVTTGLGTANGTTGYTVGDGSDADRWGAITGTATGTSSDNTNWTATTVQAFTAAQDVVITATGGNFNGTGVIYVSVQYLIGQAD